MVLGSTPEHQSEMELRRDESLAVLQGLLEILDGFLHLALLLDRVPVPAGFQRVVLHFCLAGEALRMVQLGVAGLFLLCSPKVLVRRLKVRWVLAQVHVAKIKVVIGVSRMEPDCLFKRLLGLRNTALMVLGQPAVFEVEREVLRKLRCVVFLGCFRLLCDSLIKLRFSL